MSTLSNLQVIALCFTAFGIGYGGGALVRIARRAVETLE